MRRIFILNLIVLACCAGRGYGQETSRPTADSPELRTSGTSMKTVPADLAQVTLEFSGVGKSVVAAFRAAAVRGNAIRRALIGVGLTADSLQSRSYGSNYYYYWDDRMQVIPHQNPKDYTQWDTTFVLRDVIVARIRRLELVGPAIDTAIATGATRVVGMQFGAAPSPKIDGEALEEATRTARRNAEIMATANGGKLGRLIELSTQAPSYEPRYDIATLGAVQTASAGGGGSTVVPASVTINVTVYGRWEYAR